MKSDETWGWKGIAARLGVSINHAKKLFEEEGLPVRSIGQGKKPRYFAKTAELDKWKETAGLVNPSVAEGQASPQPVPGNQSTPVQYQTDPKRLADSHARTRTLLALAVLSALVFAIVLSLRREPDLFLDFESKPGEVMLRDRRTGDALWSEPLVGAIGANTKQAIIAPWGKVLLHLPEAKDYQIAEARELLVLDQHSKEVLERVPFDTKECERVFDGYGYRPYYRVRLSVDDIDQDGSDEILVSYSQAPNFPGCTVLYEPALARHRSVYASLGHHSYQGSQDLNGDGQPEAVFSSIANRMAWYRGVAAVILNPAVGHGNTTSAIALSPDIDPQGFGGANLFWFALTKATSCNNGGSCMSVDADNRALLFGDDPELTLTFDGFSPASSSDLEGPQRRALRRKIYGSLRDAKRFSRLGLAENALPNLEEMVEGAQRIGDANLESIVQVNRVELLIADSRLSEAVELARELSSSHGNFAANMAYDIGLAFQLHRHPEEAIFWYESGFGSGAPTLAHERPRGELLRNIVLAHAQLNNLAGALAAISRFEPYVDGNWAERLRTFAAFRAREVDGDPRLSPDAADEDSYWALERVFETQGPTPEFVQLLDDALKRNSEARSLVLALYAEVLLTQGLPEAALEVVDEADPLLHSQAREFVAVATDLEIAERRIARIRASTTRLRSSN